MVKLILTSLGISQYMFSGKNRGRSMRGLLLKKKFKSSLGGFEPIMGKGEQRGNDCQLLRVCGSFKGSDYRGYEGTGKDLRSSLLRAEV